MDQISGLLRKQKLETTGSSDLTSHNVVKNILHHLIVWVINNSLIYLCSLSLSFKQLLIFITSQLKNQE